jgi:hypothetical protein
VWPENPQKWNADNYKADPDTDALGWQHSSKEAMRRGLLSNLASFGYESNNEDFRTKEFVPFPAGCGPLADAPYLKENWEADPHRDLMIFSSNFNDPNSSGESTIATIYLKLKDEEFVSVPKERMRQKVVVNGSRGGRPDLSGARAASQDNSEYMDTRESAPARSVGTPPTGSRHHAASPSVATSPPPATTNADDYRNLVGFMQSMDLRMQTIGQDLRRQSVQHDLLSEQVRLVSVGGSTSPTHGRDETIPAGGRPRGFARSEAGRVPVRVETVIENDDSSYEEVSVVEEDRQTQVRNRQVSRPTGRTRRV